MVRSIAIATLSLALAGPVAADQLARSLGVPPGVLTTAELTILRQALQDDDDLVARRVVERAAPPVRTFLPNWNPGAERVAVPDASIQSRQRLADAMGVDPADHTMAELADMYIGAYD